MNVCTVCGALWRGTPSLCPLDGGELRPIPDRLVGQKIGGRYAVLEKIGAGGMGVVYRARHEVVGRDVAIKFLAPEFASDEETRARFLREARAANHIDHEHIIDITDYGEADDDLVYLVMEYLIGEPLASPIAEGPLSVARSVRIARQIATALARAHDLGVVHRDIKPDNVFLLPRGEAGDYVKLLDFGLAAMKDDLRLTASGAVFGTPHYMAPEQARGVYPLTGAADLYALGCVLFEMLTGEPPFDGSAPQLIVQHLSEDPPKLSSKAKGVPRELEAIVERLLAKQAHDRHRDAHHLLEDLAALSFTPPSLRPPPRPDLAEAVRALRASPTTGEMAIAHRWERQHARFQQLAAEAYPQGVPVDLARALAEMSERLERLAHRQAEQIRWDARARHREEEAREARLRVGMAIDSLARDESRVERTVATSRARHQTAQAELAAIEPTLRASWTDAPDAPATTLSKVAVETMARVGELAREWLNARQAEEEAREQLAAIERELDDLRFQIGQLRGRLASFDEEVDTELRGLRERAHQLDLEVQAIGDAIATCSQSVVSELLTQPGLAVALQTPH